jgi:hypothetical protein
LLRRAPWWPAWLAACGAGGAYDFVPSVLERSIQERVSAGKKPVWKRAGGCVSRQTKANFLFSKPAAIEANLGIGGALCRGTRLRAACVWAAFVAVIGLAVGLLCWAVGRRGCGAVAIHTRLVCVKGPVRAIEARLNMDKRITFALAHARWGEEEARIVFEIEMDVPASFFEIANKQTTQSKQEKGPRQRAKSAFLIICLLCRGF